MDQGSIRIAHLSDLHFVRNTDDSSWKVWRSLRQYLLDELKPHLVLISGDLADTPSRKVYSHLGRELADLENALVGIHGAAPRTRIWLCAGNHDRHFYGNAIARLRLPAIESEDRVYTRIPSPERPCDLRLGEPGNEWHIRLAAEDSSRHARYSAQGFLPKRRIDAIRRLSDRSAGSAPARLMIMLFHHHLLPLPASEPNRQSKWRLFNLAGPVNPGTILESLAASHVDLVLHGHEHHVNRARYASYKRETVQVAMVAAGSSTGKQTGTACVQSRASFNVLELRPDRSVWCQEIKGVAGGGMPGWKTSGPPIELLDPTTLRQNYYQRSIVQGRVRRDEAEGTRFKRGEGPASEWSKHVTFTTTRDAEVKETRVNWIIEGGRFLVRVQNDSGRPVDPRIELPAPVGRRADQPFTPLANDRGGWAFGFTLDTQDDVDVPVIRTSYLWQDAVMLTARDFAFLPPGSAGVFRCEGMEFVAASVRNAIRNLVLSVTFPVGYMPPPDAFRVFSQPIQPEGVQWDPEPSIAERLQFLGSAVVLTLPFPLRNYRYAIAWRPPEGPSDSATTLAVRANPLVASQALAEACLRVFDGTPWQGQVQVATYVAAFDAVAATPVLHRHALEGCVLDPDAPPPVTLDLTTAADPYRAAWWNEMTILGARGDETPLERMREGLMGSEGETLAVFMPIQLPGDMGAPTAILRIGLSAPPGSFDDRAAIGTLQKVLALGQIRSIESLIQEVGI